MISPCAVLFVAVTISLAEARQYFLIAAPVGCTSKNQPYHGTRDVPTIRRQREVASSPRRILALANRTHLSGFGRARDEKDKDWNKSRERKQDALSNQVKASYDSFNFVRDLTSRVASAKAYQSNIFLALDPHLFSLPGLDAPSASYIAWPVVMSQ